MISLVVTDLDGTLWGEDEVVPDAHHVALDQLGEAGIPVLAATARRPRYAAAPLQANGLSHLPYVCVDGSIGMVDGQRFHSAHFQTEAILWCLDLLADHDLSPLSTSWTVTAMLCLARHLQPAGPIKTSWPNTQKSQISPQ